MWLDTNKIISVVTPLNLLPSYSSVKKRPCFSSLFRKNILRSSASSQLQYSNDVRFVYWRELKGSLVTISSYRRSCFPSTKSTRLKTMSKQETQGVGRKQSSGVLFNPEYGGHMLLRNVGWLRSIWRYIPEDRTLHNHRCENLKFCKLVFHGLLPFKDHIVKIKTTTVSLF
jgi:hypothetical protein